MNDNIYLFDQAAEAIGVSRKYLQNEVKEGRLQSYRLGKRRYVFHSDLVEYIRTHGEPSVKPRRNRKGFA